MQPGQEVESAPQSLAECEQPWKSSSTAFGAATLVNTTSVPSMTCVKRGRARGTHFRLMRSVRPPASFVIAAQFFSTGQHGVPAATKLGGTLVGYPHLQDCVRAGGSISSRGGVATLGLPAQGRQPCTRLAQQLADAKDARQQPLRLFGLSAHVHIEGPGLLGTKGCSLRSSPAGQVTYACKQFYSSLLSKLEAVQRRTMPCDVVRSCALVALPDMYAFSN